MLRVTSLSVLPEEGDHDLVCLSALADGCAPLTRTCMLKVVDAQGMGRRRLRAPKCDKCAVRRPSKKAALGAAGGTPDCSKVLPAAGTCPGQVPMAVLSRVGALRPRRRRSMTPTLVVRLWYVLEYQDCGTRSRCSAVFAVRHGPSDARRPRSAGAHPVRQSSGHTRASCSGE